jgi:chemotaxis protein methyltransferase CheR
MNTVVPLTAVRAFRNLAVRQLGIQIKDELEPLIGGRIIKRMGHFNEPLHRYLSRVYMDKENHEIVTFLDLVRPRCAPMFARRSDHVLLYTRVRGWLMAGWRRLRFWSAGCGTGEEPYGMALTVLDAIDSLGLSPNEVDFKVLATDVSPRLLEAGRTGLFERPQLCRVPKSMQRYFFRAYGGIAIADAIRDRVVFRCLNLTQPPFQMKSDLDAIFCHEALQPMIPQARQRAVTAMRELLQPDGLLCTGFPDQTFDVPEGPEPVAKPPALGPCEC